MARIKLCRSWRKFPILIVILAVVIIIARRYPHRFTDHNVANSAPSNSNLQAPLPHDGDNSHYLLPDDVVLNQDDVLQSIPDSFTGAAKCPACLGMDMCEELKNARLAFPESPNVASQHGVYYGNWHEKQIVVRKVGVGENRWQQFEEFICENTTSSKTCDISSAIVNSFAVKTDAFEASSLVEAYMIAHREPSELQ